MISTKKRKNCHKDYLPQLVFQQPSVYIENSKLSCILHDGIISWPVTHLDHPQESKSAQFYRNGLAGKNAQEMMQKHKNVKTTLSGGMLLQHCPTI